MIPANLIALIEAGQAEFKTHTTGGGGLSFIKVPENKHVVITGFSYSHFADDTQKSAVFIDLVNRCIHNVQFFSGRTRFLYTFRTNFSIQTTLPGTTGARDNYGVPLNGAEYVECYQVHAKDIAISVFGFEDLINWSIAGNLPGVLSNNESLPASYGNTVSGGEPVTNTIQFSPHAVFQPQSTNSPTPPPAGYRDQFRDDVNATTKLNTLNGYNPYSFPILNISYVLINSPFTN